MSDDLRTPEAKEDRDYVSAEMLRAAQLYTELGAYACANLAGGYDLIREMYNTMRKLER